MKTIKERRKNTHKQYTWQKYMINYYLFVILVFENGFSKDLWTNIYILCFITEDEVNSMLK